MGSLSYRRFTGYIMDKFKAVTGMAFFVIECFTGTVAGGTDFPLKVLVIILAEFDCASI